MNILNILLILYILGMAYWWSTQGIYSSLIHLVAVIISGTFAFALWETLSLDLMMNVSPVYSWTIGLITPFLVCLLIIRLVADRYLGGNVHFSQLINMLGGGALGIGSGILTAGILVLAISFLPISPSLAGYQPLLVKDDGSIEGNVGDGLLIPVDKLTANFYATLSSGAFTSDQPMRVYQPELATQAALYRMAYDPYSSPVAAPTHVSVTAIVAAPTPLRVVDDSIVSMLGSNARIAGHQLLLVDTAWKNLPGMYDGDSTLRVSPTQIRLVITDGEGNTQLLAPIAASVTAGNNRRFVPFNDNRTYVWGDSGEVSLGFMFMLSINERPRFLMARHTRLNLPSELLPPEDARQLAGFATQNSLLSDVPPPDGTDPAYTSTGQQSGQAVLNLELSDQIPIQVSKNTIQGYTADGSGLVKFSGTARRVNTAITKDVLVDHVHTPDHRRTLRVQLDREMSNSVFGAARVTAAQLAGIWLEDMSGDKWYPIAYVLEQGNGDQKIHVDLGQPLQSAKELPLAQIQTGDKFYLYFSVTRGVTITSYNVGSQITPVSVNVPR